MFVLNPKQVSGICDEILKEGLGNYLNFWAYARIDTLNDNEMLISALQFERNIYVFFGFSVIFFSSFILMIVMKAWIRVR